jgi:hypothetical protein
MLVAPLRGGRRVYVFVVARSMTGMLFSAHCIYALDVPDCNENWGLRRMNAQIFGTCCAAATCISVEAFEQGA